MTSFRDELYDRVNHAIERRDPEPVRIETPSDLADFRGVMNLRPDWHEPDEQDVNARVFGESFDNAGFWGRFDLKYAPYQELHVVFYFEGYPVAAVNLASLCAWGSAYGSVIGD